MGMNKHHAILRTVSAVMLSFGIVCMPAISLAAEKSASSTASTAVPIEQTFDVDLDSSETTIGHLSVPEEIADDGSSSSGIASSSPAEEPDTETPEQENPENVSPDVTSSMAQATGTPLVEKMTEHVTAQKPPKLFTRSKIEPVAASLPSGLERRTPVKIPSPVAIHSVSPIKPPSLHQESLAVATTTEQQIDIATSTVPTPPAYVSTTTDTVPNAEQSSNQDTPVSTTTSATIPDAAIPIATTTEENPSSVATTTDATSTPDANVPSIEPSAPSNDIVEPENSLEDALTDILDLTTE
jgi:hypothetical protein